MDKERHSVLIVEDDPDCQARLAMAIARRQQLLLAAAVDCMAEALTLLRAVPPAVLVVDIGLPDGDGIELIRQCRRLSPRTLCLVLSIYGDDRHVREALAAGAIGYLLKDAPLSELGEAIISALEGGAPLSPRIARTLLAQLVPLQTAISPDGQSLLSQREREVLDFLARGFRREEIAHHLGISINTVSAHIKHIYRKLEVNSGARAVIRARQRGLLREMR